MSILRSVFLLPPAGAPIGEVFSFLSGLYVLALADRLAFPAECIGRGDMSRGGLLLRPPDVGTELEYIPISVGNRRGKRPPRLEPRE
jgi:hypothetical protein